MISISVVYVAYIGYHTKFIKYDNAIQIMPFFNLHYTCLVNKLTNICTCILYPILNKIYFEQNV